MFGVHCEYGRVLLKSSSGSISSVSDPPSLSEMMSSSRIWLRSSLPIWLSMSCERIRMGKCVVRSPQLNAGENNLKDINI